jgi:hypothetical protein
MYPLNNTLEKIEYIHRKTIQHGKLEYIIPKGNQKKREKAKGKRLEDKTLSSNAPNGI